jgi:phospholipid/cholesterol/gamma-HCH transport system substrate-binding protein
LAAGNDGTGGPSEANGPTGSGVARYATVAAIAAAVALVVLVVFGAGSDSYELKARFINASQLVTGNHVQTGGVPIGSVKRIEITDGGQAEVTIRVDGEYAPLRRGTRAVIRQSSVGGIANRYVELQLGPQRGAPIPDGGTIGIDHTGTPVDLDQLFNTLDPRTRKALQGFIKGSARQFAGQGARARRGLLYLSPALSTSRRLFAQLADDQPALERFLVDSSKLVTTLASRRDDLTALVENLGSTTRALGNRRLALAQSLERLPPFMRRANTTFVNVRAALDDVDPLVTAAKPVARRLGPFLAEAQGFARDARPAIADLRVAARRRGAANDLTDLLRATPRLAEIAVRRKRRSEAPGGRAVDVGVAPGAFPEMAKAARKGAPTIATARPYTNDFLGWLDDFSTTGPYDALGGLARPWTSLSEELYGTVKTGQYRRCPGGAEFPAPDRSNVLSPADQKELGCDESDRAPGP